MPFDFSKFTIANPWGGELREAERSSQDEINERERNGVSAGSVRDAVNKQQTFEDVNNNGILYDILDKDYWENKTKNEDVTEGFTHGVLSAGGSYVKQLGHFLNYGGKPSYMSDEEWDKRLKANAENAKYGGWLLQIINNTTNTINKGIESFGKQTEDIHARNYEDMPHRIAYGLGSLLPSAVAIAGTNAVLPSMGVGGGAVAGSAHAGAVKLANIAGKYGLKNSYKAVPILTELFKNFSVGQIQATGESILEGESAREDYIAEAKQNGTYVAGKTDEEADKVARSVVGQNLLLLTGTDTLQDTLINTLVKNNGSSTLRGKALKAIGTQLIGGGIKGVQEGGQTIIPKVASDKPWNFTDSDVLESAGIGFLGGVLPAVGGLAINKIQGKNNTLEQYNGTTDRYNDTIEETFPLLNSILYPTYKPSKNGVDSVNSDITSRLDTQVYDESEGKTIKVGDVVDKVRDLEGKIPYVAPDGTNCMRTLGIALQGTPFEGQIDVDQAIATAQKEDLLVSGNSDYIPQAGDMAVVNNGKHMVMVTEDGGTIQNGQSRNGVYESNQTPKQMFGDVDYYIRSSVYNSGSNASDTSTQNNVKDDGLGEIEREADKQREQTDKDYAETIKAKEQADNQVEQTAEPKAEQQAEQQAEVVTEDYSKDVATTRLANSFLDKVTTRKNLKMEDAVKINKAKESGDNNLLVQTAVDYGFKPVTDTKPITAPTTVQTNNATTNTNNVQTPPTKPTNVQQTTVVTPSGYVNDISFKNDFNGEPIVYHANDKEMASIEKLNTDYSKVSNEYLQNMSNEQQQNVFRGMKDKNHRKVVQAYNSLININAELDKRGLSKLDLDNIVYAQPLKVYRVETTVSDKTLSKRTLSTLEEEQRKHANSLADFEDRIKTGKSEDEKANARENAKILKKKLEQYKKAIEEKKNKEAKKNEAKNAKENGKESVEVGKSKDNKKSNTAKEDKLSDTASKSVEKAEAKHSDTKWNDKVTKEVLANAVDKKKTAKLLDKARTEFLTDGKVSIQTKSSLRDSVEYNYFVRSNEGKSIGEKTDVFVNKVLLLKNGKPAKKPKTKTSFQIAWHGSPYVFDFFDLSRLGSGEGAQVHGWGLYYAKDRSVSEGYREKLSGDNEILIGIGSEKPNEKTTSSINSIIDLNSHQDLKDKFYEYVESSNSEMAKKTLNEYLMFAKKDVEGKISPAYDYIDELNLISEKLKTLLAEGKQSLSESELFALTEKEATMHRRQRFQFRDLSETVFITDAFEIKKILFHINQSIKLTNRTIDFYKEAVGVINNAINKGVNVTIKGYGSLLEVDIPNENVMLDEQKMFNEQTPEVQKALREAVDKIRSSGYELRTEYDNNGIKSYHIYNSIQDEYDSKYTAKQKIIYRTEEGAQAVLAELQRTAKILAENVEGTRGYNIYDSISKMLHGDKNASLFLKDLGIQGITYEGRQDGRCYVVFDDKAVKIMERYEAMLKNNEQAITRSLDEVADEIKNSLKGQNVEMLDDNRMKFTLANGAEVIVDLKENIIVDGANAEDARQAHNIPSGEAITVEGLQRMIGDNKAYIAISQNSRKGTAYHEVMHLARQLALTAKENGVLDNYYAKRLAKELGVSEAEVRSKYADQLEEKIANAYQGWKLEKKNNRGTAFGRLFQKVLDFFKGAYNVLTKTESLGDMMDRLASEQVFSDVSSGKVFSNKSEVKDNGVRYSISPTIDKYYDKVIGNAPPTIRQNYKNAIEKITGYKWVNGFNSKENTDTTYNPSTKTIRTKDSYSLEQVLPTAGELIAKRLNISDKVDGEFVEQYILGNTRLFTDRKEMNDIFVDALSKNAEMYKQMADLKSIIENFNSLNQMGRIGVAIGNEGKVKRKGLSFRGNYFYAQEVIDRNVREYEYITGEELDISANPEIALAQARGIGAIVEWLSTGTDEQIAYILQMFPQAGDITNVHSLREIAKRNGFYKNAKMALEVNKYCVAKRLLELYDINMAQQAKIDKAKANGESSTELSKEQKQTKEMLDGITEGLKDNEEFKQYTLLEGIDYEALRAELENTPSNIVNAQKDLVALCNFINGIRYDGGLISAETFNKFTEMNKNYVPLYRIDENDAFTTMGDSLKEMHGSNKTIIAPLVSIEQMLSKSAHASAINKAKAKVCQFYNIAGRGEFIDFKEVTKKDLAKFEETTKSSETTVSIKVDGKTVQYETNSREIKQALDALRPSSVSPFIRIVGNIVNVMKTMFTRYNLFFALRNGSRDMQDVLFNSQNHNLSAKEIVKANALMTRTMFDVLVDAVTGNLEKRQGYNELIANGGSQAGFIGATKAEHERNVTEAIGWDTSAHSLPANVAHFTTTRLGAFVTSIGEISEAITRLAVYEQVRDSKYKELLAKGADEQLARIDSRKYGAYVSRMTMDFQRMGAKVKDYNVLHAFANAALQDLDNTYRNIGFMDLTSYYKTGNKNALKTAEKKMRTYMLMVALCGVLPSVLEYLFNTRDDKTRNKYRSMYQSDKDKNHIFITDNFGIIKIPKGLSFGSAIPSSIVERVFSANFNNQKSASKDIQEMFSTMLPSVLPTYVLPIFEILANKSLFTGRDIVPQSLNKEGIPDEYKYDNNSSEVSKLLSRTLFKALPRVLSLSPLQIDYIINSFMGDNARISNLIIDTVFGDKKAEFDKSTFPATRSFVSVPFQSSQEVSEFKDMLAEQQRYKYKYDNGEPKPKELNLTKLMRMEKADKEIAKIQKEITIIKRSKVLGVEERRNAVESLIKKQIAFARSAENGTNRVNEEKALEYKPTNVGKKLLKEKAVQDKIKNRNSKANYRK